MNSELSKDDIDFSRGDEDIAFVHTDIDTEEMAAKDDPRKKVLEMMEERGLRTENVQVVGIFKDEFSLLLKEDAEIELNGEQIWPGD